MVNIYLLLKQLQLESQLLKHHLKGCFQRQGGKALARVQKYFTRYHPRAPAGTSCPAAVAAAPCVPRSD